jgi:hypothetical protein
MKRLHLRTSRKTECGAKRFLAGLVVRTAPFALLTMVLSLMCAVALKAQSISITTPAANATVSGFSGFSFQVLVTSAPSVVKVCYVVDSYPAYNPGIDAPTTLGCSLNPPFSMPYNSYWNGNGSHQLVATAYNALGTVVATSAAVPFTTGNTWPLNYVAGLSAATGTPVTSNWSGSVTVTPTWSGTGSADSKTFNFYIDGLPEGGVITGTATSATYYAYTNQFQNGIHNVCVIGTDNVAGTTYTGSGGVYTGAATEWCRPVNFQNGATPSQALINASAIFLAAGRTFTLTGQILNTDGSTTSTTPMFTSSNTAIATVSQSTGVVTAVANGATTINAMVPAVHGTLSINGGESTGVYTATSPFPANVGSLLQITGGTGCTVGLYTVGAQGNGNTATLSASAGTAGATGCSFTTGPTRHVWTYVWPTNTLPHFASNGTTRASYSATTSFIPHCMFQSSYMFYEQPYAPGAMSDINASGLNCFELGMIQNPLSNYTVSSTFQSNVNGWIASNEAFIAGYPKFHFGLAGDNITGSGADVYAATSGPQSQWSPPPLQYAVQQWAAQGNVIGAPMLDENAVYYTYEPLAGPISYSNSSTQSWLQSITAASGSCTATTSFGWSISDGNRGFIIHGSAMANMNSVAPAVYTAAPPHGNVAGTFTFTCTGVANGLYNSSNDPGLVLEPLGNAWYNSNTDYIHYNAFADLYSQAHAAAGAFDLSWPLIGVADNPAYPAYLLANWNANSTQFLGSVKQVADYANLYWPHGTLEPYMVSRLAANSLDQVGDIGYQLRAAYGTYNPGVPLVSLTQGTVAYYGLQGYPVPAASCSGTLCTFSAPHGLANLISGMTRLYITGATDTGGPADSTNNNFYVWDCPTATTCNVILAATDFVSTGNTANGGTATFQDGSTLALTAINATGLATNCGYPSQNYSLCGDIMNVTTAVSSNYRKRGQTFTLSGVTGSGADSFNYSTSGRTFLLLPENLNLAVPFNNELFYRELPQLSATGGTAYIIPTDNYVKGYSGSIELGDTNPGWSFGTVMECMIVRCAGDRVYQIRPYQSGYTDQGGFTSPYARSDIPTFAGNQLSGGQLSMNMHFENAATLPIFHAISNAEVIWTRLQKYILQPALNSPDTGQPWIDCSARAGSYGDVIFCLNASDGAQVPKFTLTPYLQSGQNIIRFIVNDHSISLTIINPPAGTPVTDAPTLQPLDAVFYVFPVNFATELQQPAISARLADVPHATKIVVRYGYDRYYLDSESNNVYDCGTGTCTPNWDLNVGTAYYRLIYLGANSQVLATSDVQTL